MGCGESSVSTVPQNSTPAALPAAMSEAAAAGQKIVQTVCASCHLPGLAGAPKIGDKTAWTPRVEKGMDTLVDHAMNGFEGSSGNMMPPRGGEKSLSDEEIKNAVLYLIEIHSGNGESN